MILMVRLRETGVSQGPPKPLNCIDLMARW